MEDKLVFFNSKIDNVIYLKNERKKIFIFSKHSKGKVFMLVA